MSKRITGKYQSSSMVGETIEAFVPYPLPPTKPALVLTAARTKKLHTAEQSLVRLELAGAMVPSLQWFIYAFVRKEAVVSSQIEGTQATLVDLINFEARVEVQEASDTELEPTADIEEICNYLDALTFARAQLNSPKGLPLSMRLLNETHRKILRGVRGADKQPGKVRRSQNWIGGTKPSNALYVPPPPHLLNGLLSAFEHYLHDDGDELSTLVRVGLLHAQFESIHPYLDGNGRIGRLLITLLLEHWQLLTKPLLYLSLFFKRHRDEYYQRLNAVRRDGDWEAWIDFFLDGVATIASEAVASALELFNLVEGDRERILANDNMSIAAFRLFEMLPKHPVITVASVMKLVETTKPTASRAVELLETAGVLVETTGKKRDRSFAYQRYIDRLRVGTELDDANHRAPVTATKSRR